MSKANLFGDSQLKKKTFTKKNTLPTTYTVC